MFGYVLFGADERPETIQAGFPQVLKHAETDSSVEHLSLCEWVSEYVYVCVGAGNCHHLTSSWSWA